MKIVSIEPTPSPHSMKINLDNTLPDGETHNYQNEEDLTGAPEEVKNLFHVKGVKGLYHVADFIALEKGARDKWEEVLPQARAVFGVANPTDNESESDSQVEQDSFGEVKVWIQLFRDIPMQIKVSDGEEEKRIGLPERFLNSAMEASKASDNFVMERKWAEQNPRYGTLEEVGDIIAEEIAASYDQQRLDRLVQLALGEKPEESQADDRPLLTEEVLNDPNWKVRYAALDRLNPELPDAQLLGKALEDEKASIRRLATAYLGMIEDPVVLPYLYKALEDKAVTVRRTAGDCLSDLGFKQAMPAMIESLKDKNRLVRWRAAMFLYEIGDETALPALEEATDDPEFEVKMQVNLALERIKGGKVAKGSVWHQMTEATQNNPGK